MSAQKQLAHVLKLFKVQAFVCHRETCQLISTPCCKCYHCVNSCLGSEMKLTVKVKPAQGVKVWQPWLCVGREVEEVARAQCLFIAPPTWPVRGRAAPGLWHIQAAYLAFENH